MTFYEKVLKEYREKTVQSGTYYLCSNSETFKKVWNSLDKIILINYATEFLTLAKLDEDFMVSYNVIFQPIFLDNYDYKQIRIDFLQWCIENNLDI